MGYHSIKINKGVLGEASKIQEEFEEFMDAHVNGAKILELCELADLYGAIEAYLNKKYPGTTMSDLDQMAYLTKTAFTDGSR